RLLDRFDLGYGALARTNPRIVYCSVSNYGQEGPSRDYRATELVLQATAGFVFGCGDPQREPLAVGFPLAQYVGGLNAYLGILAADALVAATGSGQQVDVSIVESLLQTQ